MYLVPFLLEILKGFLVLNKRFFDFRVNYVLNMPKPINNGEGVDYS